MSTERQADEGASLAEQDRRIAGCALQQGWQLTKVFVERGVSGSTPLAERPQGGRLLGMLRKGDIVVSTKLDRMFRSAYDLLKTVADFEKRGISLWLLDLGGDVGGDGVAKMMLTILAGVAEWERERIGERTRDAKRYQRAVGKYLGGRLPFGWRQQGDEVVKDDKQQTAIADMRKWRVADRLSFRAIADLVKAQHGIEISFMTVRHVLGANRLSDS